MPKLDPTTWLAPTAAVIGEVTIGKESSVWFGAVVRGDVMPIRIGDRVSIQDNAVVHATLDWCDTIVGDDVTVGHSVILHGCQIDPMVIIGMGTIILDHAHVGSNAIIGAGSLVTMHTEIPPGVLAVGRPAKPVRDLKPAELEAIADSARRYTHYVQNYVGDGVGQRLDG